MILIAVVALCFIAGYFLSIHVLILISAACLVLEVYLCKTQKEMAVLVTLIFTGYSAIGNAVMWVTYYIVTEQTWFGDFVTTYLMRR